MNKTYIAFGLVMLLSVLMISSVSAARIEKVRIPTLRELYQNFLELKEKVADLISKVTQHDSRLVDLEARVAELEKSNVDVPDEEEVPLGPGIYVCQVIHDEETGDFETFDCPSCDSITWHSIDKYGQEWCMSSSGEVRV